MKNYYLFAKILVLSLTTTILIVGLFYNYGLGNVSKDDTPITFVAEKNSTFLTISNDLKEAGLIRSELAYKVYLKLVNPGFLKAGTYSLNKTMDVKEIIDILLKGNTSNEEVVRITFKEGKNMRHYATLISANTNNSEAEFFAKLKDEAYLDTLIEKYWFLTDDIKNSDIYYSLEGYLFPDTYEFLYNDNVEKIINKMLTNTLAKLEPLQKDLEGSKYNVHEMLTLASIIELEAGNAADRKGVAGVFYNRLEANWALGSDVTTYYAEKEDNFKQDLYQSWISDYNAYNTRHPNMAGKLPVGPICNPGIKSITAAFEPTEHSYYYFVADKNGVTYFTYNSAQHVNKVNELKAAGLWIEYEN
jgi:UPF0755 protein